MNKIIYGGLLFVFLQVGLVTTSRGAENDWSAHLKRVYDSEASFLKNILDKNGFWQLKYTVISNVINPDTRKVETKTGAYEMIAGRGMRYLNSDQLEVFMDASDVFTINKTARTIIHTPPDKTMKNDDIYAQITGDGILKNYRVISRSTVGGANGNILFIKYDLVPIDAKSSPYSSFTVFTDEAGSALKKIYVKLATGRGGDIVDYTLIVAEKRSVSLGKDWTPVKNRIFSQGNKLKMPYSTYSYRRIKK